MKKTMLVIASLATLALTGGYLVFYRDQSEEQSAPVTTQLGQQTGVQQQWETKTDEQPPVTVTVTPVEFGKEVRIWKFDVAFDTHSGSLDSNPLTIATLIDDGGNVYEPIAWEGVGPGGHHREGILVFDAITPAPSFIELKVEDVGGIPERSFKWNLE